MSVLRIKDENGNWVGITTIKGEKGDPGDTGEHAETHFSGGIDPILPEDIGAVPYSRFREHLEDYGNPHGVTPADIGAVDRLGDTVNGNLNVNGAFAVERSDSNRKARTVAHNNADKEVDFQNYGDDSNYVSVRVATETKGVGDAVKVTQMKDGQYSDFTMLHTGNKEKIFTYGTEDLTAGSSPLGTGQLHFVYE